MGGMSRVEDILDSNAGGVPLSRIEKMLREAYASGKIIGVEDGSMDFSDADMDDIFSAIGTDND